MEKESFKTKMLEILYDNKDKLEQQDGQWIIKGFLDIDKNVYALSSDTKLVSKMIELMIFPILEEFAMKYNYRIIAAKHQNHYPDATFVDITTGEKIAVDVKTTYRRSEKNVNGFTLGAYTGYFVDRKSTKNITFPYSDYSAHIVLGVIYSKNESVSEMQKYKLEDIKTMSSVVSNFDFLVQDKYKIACERPGSGNTKNIGSITAINALKNGQGPFSNIGEEKFDEHWMNYDKNHSRRDLH